jgi:hypothetical protein
MNSLPLLFSFSSPSPSLSQGQRDTWWWSEVRGVVLTGDAWCWLEALHEVVVAGGAARGGGLRPSAWWWLAARLCFDPTSSSTMAAPRWHHLLR